MGSKEIFLTDWHNHRCCKASATKSLCCKTQNNTSLFNVPQHPEDKNRMKGVDYWTNEMPSCNVMQIFI